MTHRYVTNKQREKRFSQTVFHNNENQNVEKNEYFVAIVM